MIVLSTRKGFTLIELLVVVAIIAILAAILFPVFARARAKAFQTQCLSNMKNIATAFKVYTSDYKSWWPHDMRYAWYQSGSLKGQMAEYIGDVNMIKCPVLSAFGRGDATWGYNYRETSYGWNARTYGWTGTYNDESGIYKGGLTFYARCDYGSGSVTGRYFPANETWIKKPSATILLVEVYCKSGSWSTFGGRSWTNHADTATTSFGAGRHHYRHNSGMNVAFTDGHAQWLRSDTDGLKFADANWPDGENGINLWDIGPAVDTDSDGILDDDRGELYRRYEGIGCW